MNEEMKYSLNTTKAYHTDQLNTLGWELTVCNALYPEKTPIRRVLARDDSYGHLLYEYLNQFIPMKNVKKIIEIGGGYGYLMKDFHRLRWITGTMYARYFPISIVSAERDTWRT